MNLLLDTDERESKLPAKYHIPDCSRPDAIRDWDYHEMTADERDYLIKLYVAQPLAADRLGSTHAMDQMSTLFSAKTGRPTKPSTLYHILLRLRKDGILPTRRK